MCCVLLSHINILNYVTFLTLRVGVRFLFVFFFFTENAPPSPSPPYYSAFSHFHFSFSLLLFLTVILLLLFLTAWGGKKKSLKQNCLCKETVTSTFRIYKAGFYVIYLQIQSVYQALIQALA